MRRSLFMVADGMGGARGGEVASQMAAEEFAKLEVTGNPGEEMLREAITRANLRINERARSDRRVAGMGTTVAAAVISGDNQIAFANVGDSRAYLLRARELRLLSHDHSLVAELVRSGALTQQQAEHHPHRTVITRALGADRSIEVDTFTIESNPGDVILLCTDGLNTMVDESTIASILASSHDAASMVSDLTRAALAGGGEDNVTAIVMRLGDLEDSDSDTGAPTVEARLELPDPSTSDGFR